MMALKDVHHANLSIRKFIESKQSFAVEIPLAVYINHEHLGCSDWSLYCFGDATQPAAQTTANTQPAVTSQPASNPTATPQTSSASSTNTTNNSTTTYTVVAAVVVVIVVIAAVISITRRKKT